MPTVADAGSAAPAVPSAEQLAGPFVMTVVTQPGWGAHRSLVRVSGNSDGGLVNERHFAAADVPKLLRAVDATQWWSMKDLPELASDSTEFHVEITRGSFHHAFHMGEGCECSSSWKPGTVVAGCDCPPVDLLAAIAAFQKSVPSDLTPLSPTELKTFVAPKLSGRPDVERCLRKGTQVSCGNRRCFPQGNQLACFSSPFDEGTLVKPDKTFPARTSNRAVVKNYVWAIELADGRRCSGPAWNEPRAEWGCVNEASKKTTQIVALIWVGKALIAQLESEDAMRVAKAWK